MSHGSAITRRAVTVGALGAAAAALASAFAPATAEAADGGRVILGSDNTEESTTTVRVTSTTATNDNSPVLNVVGPGAAITAQGDTGVVASGLGSGVLGQGPVGIQGLSNDSNGVGVKGGGNGFGVWGRGLAEGSFGVYAEAYRANGVVGRALNVDGEAAFGGAIIGNPGRRVQIAAGKRSVAVTELGVPITTSSFALAVLQENYPGQWVRSAVLNPTNGTLTIILNKIADLTVDVGYLIFG
jgi:hypothetical protein